MIRLLLLVAIVLGLVCVVAPDVQAGECGTKVCKVVTAPVRVALVPIRAIRSRCATCNVVTATCVQKGDCVQKTETAVQKSEVCYVARARAGICWYPGKLLIRRRQAMKATGGWYLGKHLGGVCCCH